MYDDEEGDDRSRLEKAIASLEYWKLRLWRQKSSLRAKRRPAKYRPAKYRPARQKSCVRAEDDQ
jgi:hypothetical protein